MSKRTSELALVLLGTTGHGKSATGNSIIGANVFDVLPRSDSANGCYCYETTIADNGQILTVFDTHGSVDVCFEPEIKRTLMDNGIHAFLVVLSFKNRYSVEELFDIERMMQLYDTKMRDYMIMVFTHGDVLGDMHLDYNCLVNSWNKQLKKTLEMCGNRLVVFDNVTQDKLKKSQQRNNLLRLVNHVVANNGGVPFSTGDPEVVHTGWPSTEVGPSENGSKSREAYEVQLQKMESNHREMTLSLEKQLKDEKIAGMQAEAYAEVARSELIAAKERLRKAHTELEEKKDDENQIKNKCNISEITSAIENQIELKLQETTLRLEFQLMNKFARMQAEESQRKSNDDIKQLSRMQAEEAQRKSNDETRELREEKLNDEIRKLREDVESVHRYTADTWQTTNGYALSVAPPVDLQLQVRNMWLENALADEKQARAQSDACAHEYMEEISKLKEDLQKSQRDSEKKIEIHQKTLELVLKTMEAKMINSME